VIGSCDITIRRAVFDWLTDQRQEHGETLSRVSLESFSLAGRRIPLVGPQGIWKPAVCELPLSITTVVRSQYSDAVDEQTGTLSYAYRGTDPAHKDNAGLRTAFTENVPLVYFHSIKPGSYVASYPAFVVSDDPSNLRFTVRVDDISAAYASSDDQVADGGADARREYVTRAVRQRLHQELFRDRVLRAYQEQCALCSLRHQELLDAAHITPDSHPEGEPVVSNGVALCKLHHAAFDRLFFAVRPDYVIEVKPSILAEHDGPMLVVGLQQIHGKVLFLPRRPADRPDPKRLEQRYADFLRAG
jgi:putative restriction endonuclease